MSGVPPLVYQLLQRASLSIILPDFFIKSGFVDHIYGSFKIKRKMYGVEHGAIFTLKVIRKFSDIWDITLLQRKLITV